MIAPAQIDEPAGVGLEVRTAFDRYEAALATGDADILDGFFWDSESTVRFGIQDRQRGAAAIRQWRKTQGPLPGRRLAQTEVTTFGPDVAVVTTLFGYPPRATEGRQTQTWVRMADGWRIVTAHVSEIDTTDG